MAEVRLEQITKIFDRGNVGVEDVNFTIPDGTFAVILGPSGCGKTTTLRIIAGLETPTRGEVYIGGDRVTHLPPKDRDVAMVFQNYALYPHMSVYDNMAFGLRMRKTPRDEIHRRVMEAARILGIEELLQRKPRELSGGQRQRVALGRAIVRHPRVFLFDEPLSNLDAKMRVRMRAELARLHRQLQATSVYVTHDQVEAMTLGQMIILMNQGRIQQIAAPLELYHQPRNLFVAGFIGSPPMNFFEGELVEEGGTLVFRGGGYTLTLPENKRTLVQQRGRVGEVTLGVRPEDITFIAPEGADLVAVVEFHETLGNEVLIYGRTERGETFVARTRPEQSPPDGAQVGVSFTLSRIHLFDPGTGENLTYHPQEAP